ncbi:protein NUCLEOLAR COMPLEX ASSOCIATED 4 isoform X1 [Mangifera indica]|uniref:protein NUCLEOLAR COMPLEX ASSOCIATED 4 isoform X1 n=1 Tax=Mangifera indica TaxID=29780 RepID=UPI001CF978A6|nr:protein NUCLEOLAR COMPLEX ASSOCIATED 4 isoform X1 [Mangifera indica]
MASILSKKLKKHSLKELKTLGQQLLSSRTHINNLPLLLTFISPTSPPQHLLESLLSLQSFFTPVLPQLPASSSKRRKNEDSAKDDPEFIYKTWLRSKFDELVKSLVQVLLAPQTEDALREVVLDTLMEFVKLGNNGRFHSAIYHKLLHSIVHSTESIDFVTDLLASKYFKYTDIRYFTYISLEKLASTLEAKDISDDKTVSTDGNAESNPRGSIELSIHKIHYIIASIPSPESNTETIQHQMWSGSGFSSKEGNLKAGLELSEAENKKLKTEKQDNDVLSAATLAKKMKLKFTKAWISFLRLPLPVEIYKEVLVTLHQAVIPHLSNPLMLCDFLTRSYDIGGVVSVMALSSLFILMTQHGLEYPNFYEKLYALLVPSIFMAKHRAKFFQLLDSCLKSPLLPAYMAAAFAKKLSRLALSVPPSGALVIIALIHNLLRRHPSINCLVHREDGNETERDDSKAEKESSDGAEDSKTVTKMSSRKPGIDHFNNEESNPVKSGAMRSSLWEIDTLRHHYCPPVSRFVLSLENDLTVRAKTTEINVADFSSGSYATIFGDEIRRRVKQVPLAFYKMTPTSLFSDADFAGWTFKCDNMKENCTRNEEMNVTNISEENDDASSKRQRTE